MRRQTSCCHELNLSQSLCYITFVIHTECVYRSCMKPAMASMKVWAKFPAW